MKKLFILGVAAMLATGVATTSCSKYDEGSKFTILTKKARVDGDWTVESTENNGTITAIPSGESMKMSFKKDNTYTSTYSFGSLSSTETGKWQFSSDKKNLMMTANGSSTTDQYIIIELKSKEMKIKESTTSNPTTYKLVQ